MDYVALRIGDTSVVGEITIIQFGRGRLSMEEKNLPLPFIL